MERNRFGISCVMIVKDAERHLEATISSLVGADFDELVIVDTGSSDKTPAIARRHADIFRVYEDPEPVEIDGKKFLSSFSAARNFANQFATQDYIFWIDSDDILVNPLGLKEYLEKYIRTGAIDSLFMQYDYEHDKIGHCVMRQLRERVVRKKLYTWRSPIHEVLCAVAIPFSKGVPWEVSHIRHESFGEEAESKKLRNLEIARRHIEKEGKAAEPRLWMNYGRGLHSTGKYKEAIEALQNYLDGSEWNEERYYAILAQADCLRCQRLYEQSYRRLLDAVRLFADFKEAYIDLGSIALLLGEWDNALHWAKLAQGTEKYLDNYLSNPLRIDTGPHEIKIVALMEKRQFREAIEECNEILKIYPAYREAIIKKAICTNMFKENEVAEAYKKIEFMLQLEGNQEKQKSLLSAVPRMLHGRPDIAVWKEKRRGNQTIQILCGKTDFMWGDDSIEKGGVGGSETAVIYMARELSKLGWQVTVLAHPSEEQEGIKTNNVLWLPYWRAIDMPEVEVAVVWRSPSLIHSVKADKKYVWMHDIQQKEFWTEKIQEEMTAAIPLSKAHRENCSWIPEEKIFLSQNGLDPSFFGELKNEPHRLIYASSPNRGLQILLPMWPRIKQRFPDAVLDIYYGFTDVYKTSMQKSEYLRRIYELVMKNLDQPGVRYHGFVDQRYLSEAFHRAGIWAYPCPFGEISCITAMQAQAAGAIPVSTGFWALSETIRYGRVVGGPKENIEENATLQEKWLEELMSLMANSGEQKTTRLQMVPWARTTFLWSEVAKQWDKKFKQDLGLSRLSRTPSAAAPMATS